MEKLVNNLVSVLLPVKNGDATIKKAVESILLQTYTNFELVIVDDDSADKTPTILKGIKDPRVRIIQGKGKGLAKALNLGLKHCMGSFIARMDADDYAHPGRIEAQIAYLRDHPEIGVVGGLVKYRSNQSKNTEGLKVYVDWVNKIITPSQHYISRFLDAPVPHPTVMFRKELADQFGAYMEDPGPEDFELWLRWMHAGVRFAKINEVVLDWMDYPSRLTRTHQNYSQEAFYKVKSKYLYFWLKKKFKNEMPDLWVWGTGREVNKKISGLIVLGLEFKGHVESFKPARPPKVIHHDKLTTEQNPFVVVCLGTREGKIAAHSWLLENGFKEGESFIMI